LCPDYEVSPIYWSIPRFLTVMTAQTA